MNHSMPLETDARYERRDERLDPLRSAEDLRAMKRALIRAPLGPKAALALASAALELEAALARASEMAR